MEFDFSGIKGKRILITGGAGFLGSNLAKRCLELGAEVFIFILPDENLERVENIKDKINIIMGDLTKEEDVKRAIEGKDYLFHFAWQTELKKSMENPMRDLMRDGCGLVNILECCRKYNPDIKIIYPSTVTVVGNVEDLPSNEDVRENPESVYEIHKILAEHYLKMYYETYGLKICVLRLSNVFGEGQRIDNPNRGVLNFMIGRALRGEVLKVYGGGLFIRDYNYVQNYIDAFLLAAVSDNVNGKVFVIGSGEGVMFRKVVEKIKNIVENLTGKEVVIESVPFPEGEHKINRRNFIADSTRFREATGWYPRVGFDEGLEKSIIFYADNFLK